MTGDRDAVAAPDQSGSELEHQPHTPSTARLSADVMVDERDVHLRERWRTDTTRLRIFSGSS